MRSSSVAVLVAAALCCLGSKAATAASPPPPDGALGAQTVHTATEIEVLIVATDARAPRYEAQAVRRLLEASHGGGFWPATLAVTPESLEALLGADPGLRGLLLETRPTLVLTGPEPADGGLAACALVGRMLDVVPAAGGGAVGALLREDTPLWRHNWSRERNGSTAATFIPAGRLAAGRPVSDLPDPSIDRWAKGWTAARADAKGVEVRRGDESLVLEDVAAMAALASSVGLDPFAVPGLDAVLRKDLRQGQPADRWSPVPLPSERRMLSASPDPDASRIRLQTVAAMLARFVLPRQEPAEEAAARIAERVPERPLRAVQVFRAAHLRPGAAGQETLRRMQALLGLLASLQPRVQPPAERVAENAAQWTVRSASRWNTVFGALPDELGVLVPGEVERLHRDYRRREQRRRARLR